MWFSLIWMFWMCKVNNKRCWLWLTWRQNWTLTWNLTTTSSANLNASNFPCNALLFGTFSSAGKMFVSTGQPLESIKTIVSSVLPLLANRSRAKIPNTESSSISMRRKSSSPSRAPVMSTPCESVILSLMLGEGAVALTIAVSEVAGLLFILSMDKSFN